MEPDVISPASALVMLLLLTPGPGCEYGIPIKLSLLLHYGPSVSLVAVAYPAKILVSNEPGVQSVSNSLNIQLKGKNARDECGLLCFNFLSLLLLGGGHW